MYKESNAPVINVDVILLDPQESDVRVVGYVCGRYPRHQESKKGERQQHKGVKRTYTLDKVFSF